MAGKKEIRERLIHMRSELSPGSREKKTAAVTGRILALTWFQKAETIYSYIDCKGEIGTRAVIQEAFRLGKRVAVPRVLEDHMEFYYIRSLKEVEPGTFQILEPVTQDMADGSEGLMLLPGIAFDKNRNRIGYGKGYYDRYLTNNRNLKTVAIAFDLQIIDQIDADAWDIKPDCLITEKKQIMKP